MKTLIAVGLANAVLIGSAVAVQLTSNRVSAQTPATPFDFTGPVTEKCEKLGDDQAANSKICIVRFSDGSKCVTVVPLAANAASGNAVQCKLS